MASSSSASGSASSAAMESSFVVIEQLLSDDDPEGSADHGSGAAVGSSSAVALSESDKSTGITDDSSLTAAAADAADNVDDFEEDDDDEDDWDDEDNGDWDDEEVVELDPSGVLPPELREQVKVAVELDMAVDPKMQGFVDRLRVEEERQRTAECYRSWRCDLCESFNDVTLFNCGKPLCRGARDVSKGVMDIEPEYRGFRWKTKKPSAMEEEDDFYERSHTAGKGIEPSSSSMVKMEDMTCPCQVLGEYSDFVETDVNNHGRFRVWKCHRCFCLNWQRWGFCRNCTMEPQCFIHVTQLSESEQRRFFDSDHKSSKEKGVIYDSVKSPASQTEAQLKPVSFLHYHWPSCPFRIAAGIDDVVAPSAEDRLLDSFGFPMAFGGVGEERELENVSQEERARQERLLQMYRNNRNRGPLFGAGVGVPRGPAVAGWDLTKKPYYWFERRYFVGSVAQSKRRGILESMNEKHHSAIDHPLEWEGHRFNEKLLVEFGEPYRLWYAINQPRLWNVFNYLTPRSVRQSRELDSSVFVSDKHLFGEEDEKMTSSKTEVGKSAEQECALVEDFPLFVNVANSRPLYDEISPKQEDDDEEEKELIVPGTVTTFTLADDEEEEAHRVGIAGESGVGDGLELADGAAENPLSMLMPVEEEYKEEKPELSDLDPTVRQKFVTVTESDINEVGEVNRDQVELDDRPILPRMMSLDPFSGWLAASDGRFLFVFCTDESLALFSDDLEIGGFDAADLDEPGMSEVIKLRKWRKSLKNDGFFLFGMYDVKSTLKVSLVKDRDLRSFRARPEPSMFRLRFRHDRVIVMATPQRVFHEFVVDRQWRSDESKRSPIYYHRTLGCINDSEKDYLDKVGVFDFDFQIQSNRLDSEDRSMSIYTLFKRWIGLWSVPAEVSLDEVSEKHQILMNPAMDEAVAKEIIQFEELEWEYAIGYSRTIGPTNKVYSFEICWDDLSDESQVTTDDGRSIGDQCRSIRAEYYNRGTNYPRKAKMYRTKHTKCKIRSQNDELQWYTDRKLKTAFPRQWSPVCRGHTNWLYLMTITGDIIVVHPTDHFFEYLHSQTNCEPLIPFAISKQFGTFALHKPQLSEMTADVRADDVSGVVVQQSASHSLNPEKLKRLDFNEKAPIQTDLARVFGKNGEIGNMVFDETWGVSGRLLVYGRVDPSSIPVSSDDLRTEVPVSEPSAEEYGARESGAVIVSSLDTAGGPSDVDDSLPPGVTMAGSVGIGPLASSPRASHEELDLRPRFSLKVMYSQSDLAPLIHAIKQDDWFAPTAEINGCTQFVGLVQGLGVPSQCRLVIAVYTFLYGDLFVSKLYAQVACEGASRITAGM